jgi:hypothetical protein
VLNIDKELPVTSGHEYFTPPPKKKGKWDREREREILLRLSRTKVSFLWGHTSEGLIAVTD